MGISIVGYGTYVPKFRIKREEIGKAWEGGGRGERSVAGLDEDVVTMAVEAALNAIDSAGIDPVQDLDAVYLASVSSPYLEHSAAGVVAEVLGLRTDGDCVDFGGSTRAGLAALKAAGDGVSAGRMHYALVVASDARPAAPGSALEPSFGAGAAAFILAREDGVARIDAAHVYSTRFIDRWRAPMDPYVRDYDARFAREFGYIKHVIGAGKEFAERGGRKPGEYDHVVVPYVDDRLVAAVGKELGLKPAQVAASSTVKDVGDAGAASALLGLAAVLDSANAGEKIMMASYGSGTSDVVGLTVGDGRRPERSFAYYLKSKRYIDYVGYLKHVRILEESGERARPLVPPVSPLLERDSESLLQLVGAKCTNCGYVNFPPALRKICVRCGGTSFENHPISRRGRVHTYCVNYYMPAPFDSPMPIIVADLEDGTRYQAVGTEMAPDEVKIDGEVELVLRNIIIDRSARVYGYKYRIPRHLTG